MKNPYANATPPLLSPKPTLAPPTPEFFDGPMEVKGFCPWNNNNFNNETGEFNHFDCHKKKQCSMKFIGRCTSNEFNKVHKQVCNVDQAMKILPRINRMLWILGVRWEKKNTVCNADGVYEQFAMPGKGRKFYLTVTKKIFLYKNRYLQKKNLRSLIIAEGERLGFEGRSFAPDASEDYDESDCMFFII